MQQLTMFQTPPPVGPAPVGPAITELSSRIPAGVFLGTSSWSFPGWAGLVWDREVKKPILARHGLPAYAAHPLFDTVSVDRTYWAPMSTEELAAFAQEVPPSFRFMVKAHEDLMWARFPDTPRYGARRGESNPRFLSAEYATDAVVGPLVAGLGAHLGPIVFQFPPQGGLTQFPDRLFRFLDALPQGPLYAVEIRERSLLTLEYAHALQDAAAVHCLTVHPGLPDLTEQWRMAEVGKGSALVIRWNLAPGWAYEAAKERFSPFAERVAPDEERCLKLAKAVAWAAAQDRPAFLIANNKAEGSAPRTIHRIAEHVAELSS